MIKNTYIKCACILASLFLLSSCISNEETNYLQHINMNYKLESYKEYVISTGDFISCNISTKDKTFIQTFSSILSEDGRSSKALVVYENGTVILPYFGEIEIGGLTIMESEIKIQEIIQESILDASVTISMIGNNFYILSDGNRGAYNVYKENMTIYQALAISGQTSDITDLSKVSVIRQNVDGSTLVKTFDLRTQDVIQSEFYYIYPNDIIYFPKNKNAFFNITSLGGFISAITIPLSFLIFVSTYKF